VAVTTQVLSRRDDRDHLVDGFGGATVGGVPIAQAQASSLERVADGTVHLPIPAPRELAGVSDRARPLAAQPDQVDRIELVDPTGR
jgi:hypothetical protein